MNGYDQWLQSGDPGQCDIVCELHGDTFETGEVRGVPDNPESGSHAVSVKLSCGCWIEAHWQYEASTGWL